jgi:mono/diheme cytochrome c family protein
MKPVRTWSLLCGMVLTAAVGCHKSESATPSPAPAPGPVVGPPQPSGPQGIFAQRCARCHGGVGGTAGAPKGKAPSLAKVGADPDHTAEWIAEHIRNPKAHSPQSSMPAFASQLSDEDIRSLAEFLAALK